MNFRDGSWWTLLPSDTPSPAVSSLYVELDNKLDMSLERERISTDLTRKVKKSMLVKHISLSEVNEQVNRWERYIFVDAADGTSTLMFYLSKGTRVHPSSSLSVTAYPHHGGAGARTSRQLITGNERQTQKGPG